MRIILNKEIMHTVATDTSNKDIYYIIDFEKKNLWTLTEWAVKEKQRVSRIDKDWTNVVSEYYSFFNEII